MQKLTLATAVFAFLAVLGAVETRRMWREVVGARWTA